MRSEDDRWSGSTGCSLLTGARQGAWRRNRDVTGTVDVGMGVLAMGSDAIDGDMRPG
jgi:hypothetical protein